MGFPVLLGGLLLAVAVMSDKKQPSRGDAGRPPSRGDDVEDEQPVRTLPSEPIDQLVLDAAMGACIEDAGPEIAARIEWETSAQQHAWSVKLSDAGFTKGAQCLSFHGVDLEACMPLLDAALTTDLRAMAKPKKGASAFTELANLLDAQGFHEAADCFRPSAPRAGLVSFP